jgi:hypothetical protein
LRAEKIQGMRGRGERKKRNARKRGAGRAGVTRARLGLYIYICCVAVWQDRTVHDMMEAHVKSPDKGIRGRIGLAGGPRADRARPRISPIRSAQGPDASSCIIF